MARINEIDARLLEIRTALDSEDADITALKEEVKALTEERKKIIENGETRKKLLDEIANTPEVRKVSEITVNKPETYVVNEAEYKSAFLKNLLGQELTEAEERAYTHTTENTGAVVPKDLENKIYNLMAEEHPLLRDINTIRSGVALSIVKHVGIALDEEDAPIGDAKIVGEGEANDDEANTFVQVELTGKDFSKHLEISYRLSKMAIPAFETYLVQEIASRLASVMAKEVVRQIKSDLNLANKTTAVVDKAAFLAGLGALKQVGAVNVYMTNATFYGHVASLAGEEGLASFIPNWQDAIAGQLLGRPVKIEDALADGEILILDPKQFVWNEVQSIMIERDRDIKRHVNIISGFAIAGGVLTNDKAGYLLTVDEGVEEEGT